MRNQKSNSRGGHLKPETKKVKKENRFKPTRKERTQRKKTTQRRSADIFKPKKKIQVNNIIKLLIVIIFVITLYLTYTTQKETKDINNRLDEIINSLDGINKTQNEIDTKQTELENKQVKLEENMKILETSKAEKKAEEERLAKEKEEKAKQEAIKVAQAKKTQVTSRGGSTIRTSSKSDLQSYAKDLCINTYGWSEYDFQCLVKLWNKESGWNPNAHNKSSGAHGIPQSLPASKMASEGSDYYTNGKTQIRWGLKYIKNRYGTPASAWNHSCQKNWY